MSTILTARIEELQQREESHRATINELASLAGELRVALQAERLRRVAAERDLSSLRAEHAALLAAVARSGSYIAPAAVAEAVYPPMLVADFTCTGSQVIVGPVQTQPTRATP